MVSGSSRSRSHAYSSTTVSPCRVRSTGMRLAMGGEAIRRGYGRRMPIYALGEKVPDIHPDAYVHPDAVIIGDVRLGAEASVWPSAVLRGDSSYIEIGA